MRIDVRETTDRGAGLLLLRLVRLGAVVVFDADGGGDACDGGLVLLVAACEGRGEASFRRLAGGLTDVGEGVGSVFATEGGFEVEDWVVFAIKDAEVVVLRGGATTLVAG